jgi:hypothetical protein
MNNPQDILSLVEAALKVTSHTQTIETLGNRQTYLGMSDLSQALVCPRAVVANKLANNDPTLNLNKLLTLERGHWLEAGLEKSFKLAGQPFISQLEIAITHQRVPIKAHLDFTLYDQDAHCVTVLETKSMAKIHDEVYETHEAQVNGQIGLRSKFWNDPVFRLEGENGFTSFPQIAKKVWGVKLPKDLVINGIVLAISPNEARAFGTYNPDMTMLDKLLTCGADIWHYLNDISNNVCSIADVPLILISLHCAAIAALTKTAQSTLETTARLWNLSWQHWLNSKPVGLPWKTK